MKQKSRLESIVKSLLWRLIGVLVLAVITYAFTGSIIQMGIITFAHHFAFILIYYMHERAWLRVHRIQGKTRRILRVFTYEILLGHCVLGLISLAVTGSWISVTLITITYIENKLWMYFIYDWVWDEKVSGRFKW